MKHRKTAVPSTVVWSLLALCLVPRLSEAGSLADLARRRLEIPSELVPDKASRDAIRDASLAPPPPGVGMPVVKTAYKKVPNPSYKDRAPNLKRSQVDPLVTKMVQTELRQLGPRAEVSDLSLSEGDVRRLIGNLVAIDAYYVDDIPPEVWDRAIRDMGEVAAKEFDARKKNWDAVITSMIKTAASGILDPFSVYWDGDEHRAFRDGYVDHSYAGIGIIRREYTVDFVIPGGPAERAGLRTGDRFVSVDGAPVGSPEELSRKIQGKQGTPVTVVVTRGGRTLPAFTLVREQVRLKNVYSKLAAPNVGYAYLSQFSEDSDDELIAAIAALRDRGAKRLIIDVRGNPGGTVDSVSAIASEFLKDRQGIVRFKRQGQVTWQNVTDGDGRFLDMPVVVLINGGSASASEILAGALQDARGPVVVGSRSYGKGSAQTILPDQRGNALKITTERWYTPRDRSIDARRDPATGEKIARTGGVVPDHLVELPEATELAIMKQLFRRLQGMPPDGPAVEDPALRKALEILGR